MLIDAGLHLPALNNNEYVEFINKHAYSVYFPGLNLIPDARGLGNFKADTKQMAEDLTKIEAKKYLLFNGMIPNPLVYSKKSDEHKVVVKSLQELKSAITGLIFYDFRLLEVFGEYLEGLDLVPTINFGIDSIQKVESMLSHLKMHNKNNPSKIILDRSLTRNHKALIEISEYMRATYPEIKLELLVNEGCLPYCPYKNSHDANIALTTFMEIDDDYFACTCEKDRSDSSYNWLLASPFLRPEDLKYVLPYVDIIKIAGRTYQIGKQMKTISAYFTESFSWNLLDLIETYNKITPKLFVFGEQFPSNFYSVVSSCNKNCASCGYCKEVIIACSQHLK